MHPRRPRQPGLLHPRLTGEPRPAARSSAGTELLATCDKFTQELADEPRQRRVHLGRAGEEEQPLEGLRRAR
ncbi:Chromate resistance protein ChrB [Streptomyces sp. NPDC001817]|uniref:Chromate resistance protein ChrB n=1 Tax=Streptomyces sp. NPDC001817 TaxID=3154398 RepID=UPI00332A2EEA